MQLDLYYSRKLLEWVCKGFWQHIAKRLFKGERWCIEHPVLMMQELQQVRRSLFVFFFKNFQSLMKSV